MLPLDGPPHQLFCADSGAPILKTPNHCGASEGVKGKRFLGV